MTVFNAVLLAVLAVAAGLTIGATVVPRVRGHFVRRRVQAAGITVHEVLQQIFASSLAGIAVVDRFGDVLLSNPRAEELGLIRNRRLDATAWSTARIVLGNGEAAEVNLSTLDARPGRTLLAVHARVRMLSDADRRFAVIDASDESEQIRLDAARRDFVANISHELKTPVGAMALLAEALLESVQDPTAVQHFGSRLLGEARRLGSMVTELIALSRLQGADKLPDLAVVDVDQVVSEALGRCRLTAEAAGIEVTADAPSGLEVRGDRTLLVTALANLVENAIAYSPTDSAVSVSRACRHGQVELSVTDRGIGIAPEHQERVFERFFRVDAARSRATGGTGLGLAIVKHVAANHNGQVRLWSRQDTGSTFTVVLPVHDEDAMEGSQR
ncbi:MAG: ATP-binding protein [Actinomycetota bacterium]|nr:ATP-binding protein [Actinomycetota bacterium]